MHALCCVTYPKGKEVTLLLFSQMKRATHNLIMQFLRYLSKGDGAEPFRFDQVVARLLQPMTSEQRP
jgi:hypothetical protein